ncbi:MAG: HAD family hydrolase [Ruminococcaceae bacterium]|nr:HAD family hydrolase [Oscillospiraceae bacterium]
MNKEKDFLSGAELVCFDLDDTLVRGIHSMMYLAILVQKFPQFMRFEQMRNQFPSFLHGERAKLRLAKGLEISVIEARFAKHFKQLRNIKETVDRFHSMGIKCAVISTGPEPVVAAGCRLWGMDDYAGSKCEIVDGRLTGEYIEHMSEKGKKAALMSICERLGTSPDKAIAVGDGFSDMELFKACRTSVALNPFDENVKKETDYAFFTDDLMTVFFEE